MSSPVMTSSADCRRSGSSIASLNTLSNCGVRTARLVWWSVMHSNRMLRVPLHACCWHAAPLAACLTVCCLLFGVRRDAVWYAMRYRNARSMLHACHVAVSAYCRLIASRIAFRIARRVTACLLFVAASLAQRQLIVRQSVLPAMRVSGCERFVTLLEADSKHARRSSLRRANSGYRERYVGH